MTIPIVEHQYPAIGREKPFAIDTLKKLAKEHHRLILWTVREGKLLQEAIDFCKERGLEFYAVNRNYPEEKYPTERKLRVEMWIDDRNLGGLPDWGTIYQMIQDNLTSNDLMNQCTKEYESMSQIGFFRKLFKSNT